MKNLLLLLFLCPFVIFAQDKKIMVEGNSSGYYLSHTTAPKENFYSIGRIYNISPRVYAPYNGLDVDAPGGLSIGQVVKIPLNEINFSQDGRAEAGEVFVPLYYRAPSRVSLESVSSLFKNVPVENLRLWNKISGDHAFAGSPLIIGFLKVKSDLSPLAKFAITVPSTGSIAYQEEHPVKVVKAVTKEEPKPVAEKKEAPVVAKKEESKQESAPVARASSGGKFKDIYAAQTQGKKVKEKNGIAATFKSTSGWNDGKYYCFHNTAIAGSVVKITNPASNKSVYAKVLDVIPDISQNEGIDLRISNAAAEELGVTTEKFDCLVAY